MKVIWSLLVFSVSANAFDEKTRLLTYTLSRVTESRSDLALVKELEAQLVVIETAEKSALFKRPSDWREADRFALEGEAILFRLALQKTSEAAALSQAAASRLRRHANYSRLLKRTAGEDDVARQAMWKWISTHPTCFAEVVLEASPR